MEYTDTIIMIPARLGSSRLPNKPLLKINGIPLIIHAYNCAKNSKLDAPVVVATDDKLIFKTVSEYGGTALMTSHQHESGSDRILEALEKFDHEKKYKNIIHLQGDLPNISGNLIQKLAQAANDPLKEITTVWAEVIIDMMPFKGDYYKIRSTEDLYTQLEDNQVQLSTMKASRFFMVFEKEIHYWEHALSHVSEVVEMLLTVQRQWMYLYNVHS